MRFVYQLTNTPILSPFHLDYAINNKLTPFISMQNHYSLLYREEEREMFPTLKVRRIASASASRVNDVLTSV